LREDIVVTRRRLVLAPTGLCIVGALTSSPSHAAGFALQEQSAESQGASHAGAAARADDPSMLFFNPASMGFLPGNQVATSFSLIAPSAHQDTGSLRASSAIGGFPLPGTTNYDAATDAVAPTFYGTVQLAPAWHVGLSVTAPFGLTTQNSPTSVARYWGLTSQLVTTDVTPAVSWNPMPNLSVGAGLIIEMASARLTNSVDFGSILAGFGAPVLPGSLDGVSSLKGSDTAIGWQIGAVYQPLPGTHAGIGYRSTIYHRLTGGITFENVPLPLTISPVFTSQAASAEVAVPGNLTLGLTQDLGRFTLLLSATWTQWSVFRNLNVVYGPIVNTTAENWHDTATVSVGTDYHLNEQWTLRGGVAWDQSPVPDSTRSPRLPDGNRYWLSVGATWRITSNIAISAAYSHIFVDGTTVALADPGPGSPNFLRGNLNATYSNHINIAAIEAKIAF
jgi:long-chain fatty acid transport protein